MKSVTQSIGNLQSQFKSKQNQKQYENQESNPSTQYISSMQGHQGFNKSQITISLKRNQPASQQNSPIRQMNSENIVAKSSTRPSSVTSIDEMTKNNKNINQTIQIPQSSNPKKKEFPSINVQQPIIENLQPIKQLKNSLQNSNNDNTNKQSFLSGINSQSHSRQVSGLNRQKDSSNNIILKNENSPYQPHIKNQKSKVFLNYLLLKDIAQKIKFQDECENNNTDNKPINPIINPSITLYNNESQIQNQQVTKLSFMFNYVIGKGGFGKVWKVESKKDRKLYAMKEMSKALIITKKSVNSVMNERQLLAELKHSFLINMLHAFQDRDTLYLVMDYMSGGDLRYHIGRKRRFNEEQTRFFVACIFNGLEYLHNNQIIHRDIKPENLVLDQFGYVRVTDLGIARKQKTDNSQDTSGTPGYMAPEVMCRQSHTYAVDYFALGVIAYEFMLGRRPYQGRCRKEIRDHILAKRVQIKKNEIPDGWSLEAADFINMMIERKPQNRLGINGPQEVKNHPWIVNFPWDKLKNRTLRAPYIPRNEDNFDQRQQMSQEDEQNAELIEQNSILLKQASIQSLFSGYNFDQTQQTTSTQDQTINNTNINNTSISGGYLKENNQMSANKYSASSNRFIFKQNYQQ